MPEDKNKPSVGGPESASSQPGEGTGGVSKPPSASTENKGQGTVPPAPSTPPVPPAPSTPPAGSGASPAPKPPSPGGSVPSKPVPGKPAAPKPPSNLKPPPPRPPSGTDLEPPDGLNRRDWLIGAWAAFAGAFGALAISTARFMFPNVLFEPPMVFKAARPHEFKEGMVDERYKESQGVWIVRLRQSIFALSTVCTHLGCTPNWLPIARKFKCPCHGSGFYSTGVNFEGPAPRPLERYRVYMKGGFLYVDKSKKYLGEKNQWALPGSFVTVA